MEYEDRKYCFHTIYIYQVLTKILSLGAKMQINIFWRSAVEILCQLHV